MVRARFHADLLFTREFLQDVFVREHFILDYFPKEYLLRPTWLKPSLPLTPESREFWVNDAIKFEKGLDQANLTKFKQGPPILSGDDPFKLVFSSLKRETEKTNS